MCIKLAKPLSKDSGVLTVEIAKNSVKFHWKYTDQAGSLKRAWIQAAKDSLGLCSCRSMSYVALIQRECPQRRDVKNQATSYRRFLDAFWMLSGRFNWRLRTIGANAERVPVIGPCNPELRFADAKRLQQYNLWKQSSLGDTLERNHSFWPEKPKEKPKESPGRELLSYTRILRCQRALGESGLRTLLYHQWSSNDFSF